MNLDIKVTRETQRTRVGVRGQASLGQLLSLLSLLQVDSRAWPADEVLLDLSGLDGSLAPTEQSQVQEEAGRCLGRIRHISVRFCG